MPVPLECSRAREDFYAFILDVRDSAGLGSSHQTYTMVQGVLQAYRRRLTLQQGIRFCNALPVGLRALFVADWDIARFEAALALLPKEAQMFWKR